MVRAEPPGPAVAPDARPVSDLDFGGHAPADPGGGGGAVLPGLPEGVPHGPGPGCRAAGGRAAGVGGARLLRPGPPAAPRRPAGGPAQALPHHRRGVARPARCGVVHRSRGGQHRLPRGRGGRRRKRGPGGPTAARAAGLRQRPQGPGGRGGGAAGDPAARARGRAQPGPHGPGGRGVPVEASPVWELPRAVLLPGSPGRHRLVHPASGRQGSEAQAALRGGADPRRPRTGTVGPPASAGPVGRTVDFALRRGHLVEAGATHPPAPAGDPLAAGQPARHLPTHLHPLPGHLPRVQGPNEGATRGGPVRLCTGPAPPPRAVPQAAVRLAAFKPSPASGAAP